MTSYTQPAPKPTRNTFDCKAKAIETASKIATFEGKCMYPGCSRTREREFAIVGHHIIKRDYKNTCADPENLFPCCVKHHSAIHNDEIDFKAWLETVLPGLYEKLWQKAREIKKVDFEEIYAELLERYYNMLREKREREA